MSLFEELMTKIRNPNAPKSVFGTPAQDDRLLENVRAAIMTGDNPQAEYRKTHPASMDWLTQHILASAPEPPEALAAEPLRPWSGGLRAAEPDSLPPESVMSMPTPEEQVMSLAIPLSKQLVEAGVADPKQSGKYTATGLGNKASGAAATPTAAKPESEANDMDQLTKLLLGRERAATEERDAAKSRAESAKEMSTEEQVVTALLAALPAVIGGIGGAAINGGLGAAQGVAGGLEGSGKGIGILADARKGRIADAKGEAAEAQHRIDQVAGQQLAHTEHLGDQAFAKSQQSSQQAFSAQQAKAAEAAQLRRLMIEQKGAMDRVREQNAQEFKKAELSAGLKGIKIEDADKAFYVNAHSAARDVEELKKAINQAGNVEINYVGDPKVRAILKGRALDLAIAYAKIVDPGSAAREGEVETAMKLGFPMGMLEGNETSIAGLDNILQMIREKGNARSELGLPTPASLNAPAGASVGEQPDWRTHPTTRAH
jgi:hypothetical protein